jgi:signal transduction histidine kinase
MSEFSRPSSRVWRYLRGLAPPTILFALLIGILIYALEANARDEMEFEENALKEWAIETRLGQSTLAELVRQYLQATGSEKANLLDALRTHLQVLGDLTRSHEGLLPLFPYIYRMELRFEDSDVPPIIWDSSLPLPRGLLPMKIPLDVGGPTPVTLVMQLQLRAYANRQEEHAQKQARLQHGLTLIAIAATGVALLWITLFLRRERSTELQEFHARRQLDELERKRLEEQLRREEEELKRHEAEKQVLEARTKLYADISVLAGSYAHNIKNLLVRPNDLIQRCLDNDIPEQDEHLMLSEARDSLRNVAERTQQILQTVRRELQPAQLQTLDLNSIVQVLDRQWRDIALQQWSVDLRIEISRTPIHVQGDASHLQQALENLLCNARDATFEQRNRMRAQARATSIGERRGASLPVETANQVAILAAAAWKGEVMVGTRQSGNEAILYVRDNGLGMTEEVKGRCTEAHFTTKRDNAMLEGQATGMGLGLSFVAWVVEQHGGRLEIDSQPLQGTEVRIVISTAS